MRGDAKSLLRVYIEGKGCDGFYYGVAFDDERRVDDTEFEVGGLTVVIDKDSLSFMEGSEVIWVDDERGKGFLVENPRQRAYRGKFYKRKEWQAKQKPTEQSQPSE
jgi:iron-sulfur cluster assembly accessory protein